MEKKIRGKLVDIHRKEIYGAEITVNNGLISSIKKINKAPGVYIMPGLIDAHIHIESSMVIPSEFAREAVKHGTVATVSDPHEIANVLGVKGVDMMIENGETVPFKFYFGAPSCVPATDFETAGAKIGVDELKKLLQDDRIKYLSEMMNYPGVIHHDHEVMAKIRLAREVGKPIDGHSPGLRGDDARKYAEAGISTDHECYTLDEALEKIQLGMKIIIREGSAAKNFEALYPLIDQYPEMVMLCSDDKHPDDLILGHINKLIARAVSYDCDLFHVLRSATINPVQHYGLEVGLLREGDPADLVIVKNLKSFEVSHSMINGDWVYKNNSVSFNSPGITHHNKFIDKRFTEDEFKLKSEGRDKRIKVIKALDGELITKKITAELTSKDGYLEPDTGRDILKISVVNRYERKAPSIGFITGFGLRSGAIASSVAHDSHNIVAVGVDDYSIMNAVNLIIENKGGVSLFRDKDKYFSIPLPIAGLMSDQSCQVIGKEYEKITKMARELGSPLHAPFMTLSFMALLVIPELKMSDKGLFDASVFNLVPLVQD